MNQVKKINQLKNLSYFDKNTLSQIFNLKDKALYENIQRWLGKGYLIQLKKGFYVSNDFLKNVNRDYYSEFVANRLRYPSYLSLEYILQKYSIMTESVFAFTSITLKTKYAYQNNFGRFIYRGVKDSLFCGYEIKQKGSFEVYQAKKAKALFDFLYLKLFRVKKIDKAILESFRLNLDDFSNVEKKEFKNYCSLAGVKKYQDLGRLLFH